MAHCLYRSATYKQTRRSNNSNNSNDETDGNVGTNAYNKIKICKSVKPANAGVHSTRESGGRIAWESGRQEKANARRQRVRHARTHARTHADGRRYAEKYSQGNASSAISHTFNDNIVLNGWFKQGNVHLQMTWCVSMQFCQLKR